MSSWTESEWDDDQWDLIAAERFVQVNTGPNGEWMPEATSDEADPMSYSGWRPVVDGPFTNQFEKARLDAIDAHRKTLSDGDTMNGVFFTVRKHEY